MGRRTILLLVAVLLAVLGAGMVFLYVQGADQRAKLEQAPVQVLKAVAQIEPGESLAQAQETGKLELGDVPAEQRLQGAIDSIGDSGGLVALTTIYPNEQITTTKFGAAGDQEAFELPNGTLAISVNLSDTGRVAGFVTPGSEVALFMTGITEPDGDQSTRLLLPAVQVIAVAQTTVTTSTTTTVEDGAQTTEALPRTLFTLAVDQQAAEKILFASSQGELSFGLLGEKSKVRPGDGVTLENLFG